jgi:hypothetical protein
MYHDGPLAGHRAFEKTAELIKSRYFWPGMHKQIKDYCSSCHLRQTKKYVSKSNKAALKPILVDKPWVMIGLDVTGPLKLTASGNLYIIIAVDYFSKFCIARAIPDFTALTTAKFDLRRRNLSLRLAQLGDFRKWEEFCC